MADQPREAQGTHWDGFAPGQTPAPPINGAFRTYIDGENARVVSGQFGKQLLIPARVSLGKDGERTVNIYCPYNFGAKGKIVSIFKAVSGIVGDLPDDFDLSTLATAGDVLAEVATNDKGYLDIKTVMVLPRYENGAPNVPAPATIAPNLPANIVARGDGNYVNIETGELIPSDAVPF